jgi:hypothetical protein
VSLCNKLSLPGAGVPEHCSFEAGHLGDHSWALEPAAFGRSSAPVRTLVRCGCGLVRTDEDALAHLYQYGSHPYDARQQPRVCRGCSCVYMLPKQQPPSSSSGTG